MDLMQTMAGFCLPDPGCLVLRSGTCAGCFCHGDICHAAGCPFDGFRRRQVPEDIVEATRSFGATSRQLLFKVQLPLALPDDYDGSESNDYDGVVYGGDCRNDLRRRFGGDRIERYYPDEDRSWI